MVLYSLRSSSSQTFHFGHTSRYGNGTGCMLTFLVCSVAKTETLTATQHTASTLHTSYLHEHCAPKYRIEGTA